MVKLKRILRGVKVKQKKNSTSSNKIDDPWFYCTLCFEFMKYSELIDGCLCRFCEKDLFIVPWSEFKNIKPIKSSN